MKQSGSLRRLTAFVGLICCSVMFVCCNAATDLKRKLRIECAANEVFTGEEIALQFYDDEIGREVSAGQVEYFIDKGDENAVRFDQQAGTVSFAAEGKYFVRFYQKGDESRAGVADFCVIDAANVIRGSAGLSNETASALPSAAQYRVYAQHGAAELEASAEIDLERYFLEGEKTASLRITPLKVFKFTQSGRPLADGQSMCVLCSDGEVQDITGSGKQQPRILAAGYDAFAGEPYGERITETVSMDDYDARKLDAPETLILTLACKVMLLPPKSGRYTVEYSLVNAVEPSEIYATQTYLLIASD